MIKGILFDYGGTIDTNARHWAYVLHEAYEAYKVPISVEQFREAYVFAERALAKAPIVKPADDFLLLLKKKIKQELAWLDFRGYYSPTHSQQEKLVEDLACYCNNYVQNHIARTLPTLEELTVEFSLAIVSNFYGNLSTVISAYGLDRFFPKIVESAVVGVRKPNPEIFRIGVQAIGLSPEETIVVGDSYRKDIEPASAAGCHTVWIHGEEWAQEKYDTSLPTRTVTDFLEVLPAIRAICKAEANR